jgi:hypothetical protein
VLDEYVRDQSVFMRPGSDSEVVFEYLVPAGLRLVEVRDPRAMPVAVLDYHRDFYVIAYGDGHAELFEGKADDYTETWEAWWREFEEERAGSGEWQ